MIMAGLTPARAMPPTTASILNAAFNIYGDTSGRWAGGDSTASVTLPDGRVVWLFSDTFIGAVNADHSLAAGAVMVNNSAVVQSASGTMVSTLTGGTAQSPSALVSSAVSGEYYWVADGTATASQLQVLYNRYRRTGPEPLDVAITDTALATFALPSLALIGVADLGLGDEIAWGSALFDDGGYTYIYGSELSGGGPNFAHIARAPVGGLAGPWQFWTGSAWSSNKDASIRVLSGVGTAFGVQKMGSQYVLVTVEGHLPFNPETVAYTAAAPTGPFAGPISLFVAPDAANDPDASLITYDARVHPEFAPSGKLLVSYNVNSLEPGLANADVRRYRPRFVEVAWPAPAPGPGVPSAPTGLTATANTDGGIHLAWQGTASGYVVYLRDVTGGWTGFAGMQYPSSQTSADPGFLRDGHTYEFKVSAVNSVGEGPASTVASATATVAPTPAVTGVSVTADNIGRATVSWTAVAGAWNYRVHMRDVTAGQTDFIKIKSVGPDTTSATVEWLEDNHEYEFYVVATNGAGASAPSALVRVTSHHSAPSAPTGLTALSNPDGTIAVSWTAPGPDLWYWVYQRDITAGETAFTKLPLPITTGTAMTADYLLHGHEYEYQVTATNRIGESPASATARATANHPAPGAPSALAATAADGQVVLSWTASATPDVWYLVYQRDLTAGETAFTQLPIPVTSCCTMTAGYLANGHTYEFKVAATKAGRNSAASNTTSATPQVPPPGQVTGLVAAAQGDGSVALSWTAPGPNLWFNVYQRDVTAGESTFTKLPLPVTTCCTVNIGKDFNLNNHLYEYRVAATNSGGEGPPSATAQATAHYDPPPAPTNLRGVGSGDGYIQLDWDYPSQTYFWIYYRDVTAGATSFTKSAVPTNLSRATWGPLPSGHLFEFKVTATNADGEGPASNTIQVTAKGGLPLAPSNLSAVAGDGQVTLSWTASPTANVWYLVYQRDVTTNQSWQKLPIPITSCCTMTAGLLANGHNYEFKVTATNSSGDSGPSNVALARPLPPIPQPPTGLTATPGNGQVVLRWTASTTAPVWYWIEYRVVGGAWKRISVPFTNCCTATLGYLTNFTTYQFRVFSNNLAGDSTTSSNIAPATPVPPVPAAPTSLTASASNGKVQLHWTASTTPNVSYWIEWRKAGASTWTRADYPIPCCDFTAGYLINGVTYQFRVITTNGYESAPSNVVPATPWVPLYQSPYISGITLGQNTEFLWWTPVQYASGYWVEYQNLSKRESSWTRLQYPVTSTSLAPQLLNGATWYRWRVVPYNGAQEGPASNRIDIRTGGRAIYDTRNVLGDSYSAGIGAGNETHGCVTVSGRPDYGDPYRGPYAWGMMLPVWSTNVLQLSCNGARIKHIYDHQIPNLRIANNATLITMTIGGNDVGFSKYLEQCAKWNLYWLSQRVFFTDCTFLRPTIEDGIRAQRSRLVTLYKDLVIGNPGADIIVAGYPKLLVAPTKGKCDAFVAQAFADADHRMIRQLSVMLNDVIQSAAEEAGIMNATDETLSEFEGHEACANDEYINQLAGLQPSRNSFHPKYAGQQAYVRAVMNALRHYEFTGDVRRP